MAIHNDDAVNIAATPAINKPVGKPSLGLFGNIKRYLREVIVELKKTNWPTRDELTKSTIVIMLTIVAVAFFLFIANYIAGHFMTWIHVAPESLSK